MGTDHIRGTLLLLAFTKMLHTSWLVARLDPLSMAVLLNFQGKLLHRVADKRYHLPIQPFWLVDSSSTSRSELSLYPTGIFGKCISCAHARSANTSLFPSRSTPSAVNLKSLFLTQNSLHGARGRWLGRIMWVPKRVVKTSSFFYCMRFVNHLTSSKGQMFSQASSCMLPTTVLPI